MPYILYSSITHLLLFVNTKNDKNIYDFYYKNTKKVLTKHEFRDIIYTVKGLNPSRRKDDDKMSRNELIAKIEQLKEWEAILEEANAEAEAIRDTIKAQMLAEDTEELEVGAYIVRWTSVLSNRFDSTAFKREHAELYKDFTKQVASKRFSIV